MRRLETRFKEKLPKGWSYPAGAELLSEWLGDIPHGLEKPLWFSARAVFWTNRFAELRAANEPYEVLKARYGRGAIFSEDRSQPFWDVHVNAVPSTLRFSTRRALASVGLPRLRRWLLEPRADTALDGGAFFAFLLREQDPSFVIRTRSDGFSDPVDAEVTLPESGSEMDPLHNNALHLTAPLGAVVARSAQGASRSPFGERRRRR